MVIQHLTRTVGIHLIPCTFLCTWLPKWIDVILCMYFELDAHKPSNFHVLSSDFYVTFVIYLSRRARKNSGGEKRNRKQKLSIFVKLWLWYVSNFSCIECACFASFDSERVSLRDQYLTIVRRRTKNGILYHKDLRFIAGDSPASCHSWPQIVLSILERGMQPWNSTALKPPHNNWTYVFKTISQMTVRE